MFRWFKWRRDPAKTADLLALRQARDILRDKRPTFSESTPVYLMIEDAIEYLDAQIRSVVQYRKQLMRETN
jgi:hypothetical protein